MKGATPPCISEVCTDERRNGSPEARHHTAPRGQRTARAEATYAALRSRTTSVAGDTEFCSLYEYELGGTRPDRLYEVRPQERYQRRTVEQNVDNSPFLPTLDVPVPQMENQLVEVCRQLDTHGPSDVLIPEQAIEVPKISSSRHSHRRSVRFVEQTAEQLVEVPTIISYPSLCWIVEQNVDIPVPRGRGRVGLGLHPGQSSTAQHSTKRISDRIVEQIVETPVFRGGPQGFHPGQSSSSSSHRLAGISDDTDDPGDVVFRTFPNGNKVRSAGQVSPDLPRHVSSVQGVP